MAIDSKHPLYDEFSIDWTQCRDSYGGERIVKRKGREYLPATSGMEADGIETYEAKGYKEYEAYLKRAVFPEIVKEAVEAMIGVMHHKQPVIELPTAMEPLRERASIKGESLAMVLRRINTEQLVTGRVGVIADVPSVPTPGRVMPYLALYNAEVLVNWDDSMEVGGVERLRMVVLDESEHERTADGFDWRMVQKHRVLLLGTMEREKGGKGVEFVPGPYRVGVFRESKKFSESEMIEPSIAGRKVEEIPFEIINAKDVCAEPDTPPLIGLSNLAMAIYRGEADYRQALFMQGQDTLVIIGGEDGKTRRTGAGATIELSLGEDAKFIGVDSSGLPEMRSSLENDYARAQRRSGELVNETSRERESGDALRVRVAARTATLNQIALAGAFGLQSILRKVATWIGANPEEVVVMPNLDFVDDQLEPKSLLDLMVAKKEGAPLSIESIHKYCQDRGMTEKTFEEEIEAIEREVDDDLAEILRGPGMEDDEDPNAPGGPDGGDDDDEDDEGDADAA